MKAIGLAVCLFAVQAALCQQRADTIKSPEPSDLLLREACVRWFMPQFNERGIDRNPKWKNILLTQDPQVLIPRLERIRSGRVHYVEYSAISFVLAYIGHEPAANTRKMLAPIDLNQERPRNGFGWHVDDPKPFGNDDIIKGFGDSTFQLFEHNPRHDVLAELLGFGSDGETGYFKSWLTKQLFLKYPSAVLRVASQQGLCNEVGMHLGLWAPREVLPSIRSTLKVMARDGRRDIREAATKVAAAFKWHLG